MCLMISFRVFSSDFVIGLTIRPAKTCTNFDPLRTLPFPRSSELLCSRALFVFFMALSEYVPSQDAQGGNLCRKRQVGFDTGWRFLTPILLPNNIPTHDFATLRLGS